MRSPLNNPTERIGRLIEEFDEALFLVSELYDIAGQLNARQHPSNMLDLPTMPRFPNLEAERTRRSLTYSRSIHRNRARKALDAVRTDEGATVARAIKAEQLTSDDIAELLERHTEKQRAVGDQFKKPDKLDL